jgi:GDPmannose 4,6-dehydratase
MVIRNNSLRSTLACSDTSAHPCAGDLCDANAITHLIKETQPDEIYNLAAQSHVAVSFKMPMYTADVNATGTLILLEAVRLCGLEHKTRFYQVRRL